jgi:DNA repair protein RecN (Recombination protein N)
VTGETGAGKTMLTEALGLVLGGRGDAALVGPGAAEAYVEATFALAPGALDDEAFAGVRDLVPEDEDDTLVVARRVTADGRGRALVLGRAATRGALEAAGERLVGVVSQHEARALVRPAVQRSLLDAAAGPKQAERLVAMAAAWRALGLARAARERAESDAGSVDALADELRGLVERVDAVDPQVGEDERLRAERERLRHADLLLRAAHAALELLNPEEGEGAVASGSRAVRELDDVVDHDPALAPVVAELRDAQVRLEEAARSVREYAEAVEHDPVRLDEVEGRLAALRELADRHGSLEGALLAAEAARVRLSELTGGEAALERLRAEEQRAWTHATERAEALGAARRKAAKPFARAIEAHLADLGMADAQVELEVESVPLGPGGAEAVRLLVAPNPGHRPAPVADAASGGELSRIALAIRVAAHDARSSRTLVFDEIDAGVGGRTARAVGEKLRTLAQDTQVICVTHLPQIAALADRHFRVVKEPGDPTVARIDRLAGPEVDEELARMLGAEPGAQEGLDLARALRGAA